MKVSFRLQTFPFILYLFSHYSDTVKHRVQVKTKWKCSCQRARFSPDNWSNFHTHLCICEEKDVLREAKPQKRGRYTYPNLYVIRALVILLVENLKVVSSGWDQTRGETRKEQLLLLDIEHYLYIYIYIYRVNLSKICCPTGKKAKKMAVSHNLKILISWINHDRCCALINILLLCRLQYFSETPG